MRAAVLVAAVLLQAATPAMAGFSFKQVCTAYFYAGVCQPFCAVLLSLLIYCLYGRGHRQRDGLGRGKTQSSCMSMGQSVTWAAWMPEWRASCLCLF